MAPACREGWLERSRLIRVEVFRGGAIEESAEPLDLVGLPRVVGLDTGHRVDDGGRVEHGVLGLDRDAQMQGEDDGVADPDRYPCVAVEDPHLFQAATERGL